METITRPSRVTGLPSERPARVVEEFEQPRYSRRETLLTMFGVLMVMLLGSLDQTIVATAIPHKIADIHGDGADLRQAVRPVRAQTHFSVWHRPFPGGVRAFRHVTVDESV